MSARPQRQASPLDNDIYGVPTGADLTHVDDQNSAVLRELFGTWNLTLNPDTARAWFAGLFRLGMSAAAMSQHGPIRDFSDELFTHIDAAAALVREVDRAEEVAASDRT